jgi:two-component system OmpR family response regulator
MPPLSIVPSPDAPPRRRRILAIDDDDGLLDMLVLLLRQEHLDFRAARGGQDGLDMALAWEPDLILLDLTMPDLDGSAFVELYRAACPSPAPIVLLTGALDGLARATELGVTMFLTKPFDLSVLVEVVDAYAWSKSTDVAFG